MCIRDRGTIKLGAQNYQYRYKLGFWGSSYGKIKGQWLNWLFFFWETRIGEIDFFFWTCHLCQGSLALEEALRTDLWDVHVATTLIGMTVVDSYHGWLLNTSPPTQNTKVLPRFKRLWPCRCWLMVSDLVVPRAVKKLPKRQLPKKSAKVPGRCWSCP